MAGEFFQAVQGSRVHNRHAGVGLSALESTDRSRVACVSPATFVGSIHVENAMLDIHWEGRLWDYGVCVTRSEQEAVYWIEVHPANNTHIAGMVQKVNSLKRWLREEATELETLTASPTPPKKARTKRGKRGNKTNQPHLAKLPYVWVATDARVAFTRTGPEARQLANAGIRFPCRRLELD